MNEEVYDVETFPNVFTICFKPLRASSITSFEISERRDQRQEILERLKTIDLMIGFNNIGFDWILVDHLMRYPNATTKDLYDIAQHIIESGDRFGNIIWDPAIDQLDLMRVHHFDNRAKMTSLKTLEFNMRRRSIKDLPFPVGTYLRPDDIDVLLVYNAEDVLATEEFYHESKDEIDFRRDLDPKWLNYNDSKIGKQIVIDALIEAGVQVYEHDSYGRRKPRQTRRPEGVKLKDIIFPWIDFKHPTLKTLLADLRGTLVTDTKADLKLQFDFAGLPMTVGSGGLHGSVKRRKYTTGTIIDLDVEGYYTAVIHTHQCYPEHLGPKFCEVVGDIRAKRKLTKKGTTRNKSLKLAGNSVFGDLNNYYGPFLDPACMLKVTINGQLMLLMLIEELAELPDIEFIQANTDGITIRLPEDRQAVNEVAEMWEAVTGMVLEEKRYKRLFIRDVNNYIGEFTDGTAKRKGAYEYEREWWQNHSGLVIPKGAEAFLLRDVDPETFVALHPDNWDFMFRVRTNEGTHISFDSGMKMKGTIRYYLSKQGSSAVKIMPKTQTRLHGTGYTDPEGKRGNWKCSECDHVEKTKSALVAHIEACHASKLVVKQEYDGEPIDIDTRAYVSAIEELVKGFV